MEDQLAVKIRKVFGRYSVDKRRSMEAGFELMPRFVTEFLIAASEGNQAGLSTAEVRERIQRFSVDADRKGEFIHRLMRDGEATLIALLEIEPQPSQNAYIGRIAQLDGHDLTVDAATADRFKETMYGGLWGSCTLKYERGGASSFIRVKDFVPYQLSRPDMAAFRDARKEFSLDEWVGVLLSSAGYRPAAFPTFRHQLLALARLLPLVQPNLNLLELGPRGTGKSYLLRNLSARSYLLAGAKATPASLMYNLSTKEVGIVGRRKVVVFDEIASTTFSDQQLVAMMKDYMESGQIARGGKALTSDCSFLFTGNIDMDGDGRLPRSDYVHLFEVLPPELCDTAIGDRIHGFIPGWELPKISDAILADGQGLLSDYFGEVLGEMRREVNFVDAFRGRVKLENATQRDKTAVERMAAGMLKMLFPDGKIDDDGLRQVASIAVELRQRVHNQLERMAPGEYRAKSIGFDGMDPHVAADIIGRANLTEHDLSANTAAQVGKVTILYTLPATGGGDRGFVECAHVTGTGLQIVGLRGPSLTESVKAAYNALLHLGEAHGLPPTSLLARKMTVGLVELAAPKDGPSAGLAFGLAMLSAATGRAIKPGITVTGELSLHGGVGPVGGIAEKVTAAYRAGRKTVLIPAANAAELQRIPDIVAKIEVIPVRTFAEAVSAAVEN